MGKREQQERQRWYRAFEAAVTTIRPDLSGRIDWTECEYLAITRADIDRAARAYSERHP